MRVHREVDGKMKQVTVKKYPSGKWYVSISVECEKDNSRLHAEKATKAVGIDLGIMHFASDSVGNHVNNPKFMTVGFEGFKVLQQILSRKKKGSANRQKQRIKVARQFEKIYNQRNDFLHKLSRHYVNSHDIIAVEALEIRNNQNIIQCKKHKRCILVKILTDAGLQGCECRYPVGKG